MSILYTGNILFVQAPTLYSYYAYHAKLRSVKKNPFLALTQSELNALHVGPPMYMSYRYAQILAIFFVTLTFDTGMPILNFVAALNYLVFYCLEKFFFIRLYCAPYRFGSDLGRRATSLIPFAVIIHLAMTIWILSNQSIFSTSNSTSSSTGGALIVSTGTQSTLNIGALQRINYTQTFPLFLIFLGLIAAFIGFFLFNKFKDSWRRLFYWIIGAENDFDIENVRRIRKKLGFGANIQGKRRFL